MTTTPIPVHVATLVTLVTLHRVKMTKNAKMTTYPRCRGWSS